MGYERVDKTSKKDPITSVGKIEGYQELTNRLQRYLNHRFINDVDELKKQQSASYRVEVEVNKEETGNRELEQRIQQIETNYVRLREDHTELKSSYENIKEQNQYLMKKIDIIEKDKKQFDKEHGRLKVNNSELNENITKSNLKQKMFENVQQQTNKHTDEQLLALTHMLKQMKITVDKHDEELSLIVNNDAAQDERLDILEDRADSIQDTFKNQNIRQDSGAEILQKLKEGFKTSSSENILPAVLEDILNINRENRMLIERIEKDEKRTKKIDLYSNNNNDEDVRKSVDQNMKDITDIKENFKNKSCFIDRIKETQNSIMDELLLMKKQREIAEVEMKQGEESIRNLNNLVQQLNSDSGSFSDFQSFVQKEKKNSDEQFQNIKQQIKECKVSKDDMLKGDHKLNETQNKVIKLEQEFREYMRNNTKQKKANNFDELIEVMKATGKKVETLEELVETLEKCCSKTSNKKSTIDESLNAPKGYEKLK